MGTRLSLFATAVVAATAAALVPALPASAAPVAHTSVVWEQDPWEEGGEVTRGVMEAPAAKFQSLQDRTISRINVNAGSTWWSISLAPPIGETLHPGIYRNAERAGFQSGRAPGLEVSRGSSSCNSVAGEFAIHQIAFDSSGTVSMLEASITHLCEGAKPELRLELRYQATELSYDYQLEDEWSETPPSHLFRGATSTFNAQTFWSTAVRFDASGDRMGESIEFYPPTGEKLTAGTTYTDVQGEPGEGHAGIQLLGFPCSPVTGTFTIKELEYDADGEPTALSATFAIECPHIPRKMSGTVHFNA